MSWHRQARLPTPCCQRHARRAGLRPLRSRRQEGLRRGLRLRLRRALDGFRLVVERGARLEGMDRHPLGAFRENRLRRMADRQWLVLHKSRRRDPRAIDYGRWWLVHPDERTVELTDIDALERYLTGEES